MITDDMNHEYAVLIVCQFSNAKSIVCTFSYLTYLFQKLLHGMYIPIIYILRYLGIQFVEEKNVQQENEYIGRSDVF